MPRLSISFASPASCASSRRYLVERWPDRLINIHPSLLPAFPGLDTHARALDAGVKLHGATVHFVRAGLDDGPIIAQAAVPVTAADTPESLAARVLAAEHRLYPLALSLVARGQAQLVGDKCRALPETRPASLLLACRADGLAVRRIRCRRRLPPPRSRRDCRGTPHRRRARSDRRRSAC